MIATRSLFRTVCNLGRRGSLSIVFAASMFGILATAGIALNLASLADARAALQRAADNAALSGASSYVLNSSAFNTLAITTATSTFCNLTASLPMGATLSTLAGGQSCGAGAGPTVTAVTDSYVTGTPGITHASGISCTATYLPPAPYNCGFIVTVTATATLKPVIPYLFGSATSVSVSGMAVNPFINFAKVFSLPNGMGGGAKYANSVWAYALSLNAAGAPDYVTNNTGAVPNNSNCSTGPDTVTCGPFVMLGNTMYVGKGTGYVPPGQSVTYDNGVVRNPVTPTAITATTPLGIAFESIAGGNYVQYANTPGIYGYMVTPLGPAAIYKFAPNGCIYPYNNLVYQTVGQVWTADAASSIGYDPLLPWSLVTHWFYSSYLGNNYPPSQGILSTQSLNNEVIPSVPYSTQGYNNGNIGGLQTYMTVTPLTVPTTAAGCPATTKIGGLSVTNSTTQTSIFPAAGNTNCSVYITVATTPTQNVTPPFSGGCYTPSSTPGQSYANLSCQGYGSNYYTFWWNDMGGAIADDYNYSNGIVQLNCSNSAHVVLIN